jgi:hypothetical protein
MGDLLRDGSAAATQDHRRWPAHGRGRRVERRRGAADRQDRLARWRNAGQLEMLSPPRGRRGPRDDSSAAACASRTSAPRATGGAAAAAGERARRLPAAPASTGRARISGGSRHAGASRREPLRGQVRRRRGREDRRPSGTRRSAAHDDLLGGAARRLSPATNLADPRVVPEATIASWSSRRRRCRRAATPRRLDGGSTPRLALSRRAEEAPVRQASRSRRGPSQLRRSASTMDPAACGWPVAAPLRS